MPMIFQPLFLRFPLIAYTKKACEPNPHGQSVHKYSNQLLSFGDFRRQGAANWGEKDIWEKAVDSGQWVVVIGWGFGGDGGVRWFSLVHAHQRSIRFAIQEHAFSVHGF